MVLDGVKIIRGRLSDDTEIVSFLMNNSQIDFKVDQYMRVNNYFIKVISIEPYVGDTDRSYIEGAVEIKVSENPKRRVNATAKA